MNAPARERSSPASTRWTASWARAPWVRLAAEHLILRSQVAVKLIDPQIASDAEALARFLREARAAASLRSPHVVRILDHGVDNGSPYIVMELLEGESLGDRLAHRGALPAVEVAEILVQVARAVTKAHEVGIVHRDLKPDNIFIVHNDDADLAKVLDFGIAKETGPNVGLSSPGTRSGALMGTPVYMSPEQAEGTKQVDFRSDLWSLGVIAYECLLGRRPFESEAIGSLVLDICSRPLPIPSRVGAAPPGFDAWFARACARDPAQRFTSAKEQMHELRRILDGEHPSVRPGSRSSSRAPPPIVAESSSRPITATLVSTTDPLSSGARQHPSAPPDARSVPLRVVVLVAGAGAALLAVFFFYFVRPGRIQRGRRDAGRLGPPGPGAAPIRHRFAVDRARGGRREPLVGAERGGAFARFERWRSAVACSR